MINDNDSLTVLKDVAMSAVIEQRRRRRWGIFFKLVFLLYVTGFIILNFLPIDFTSTSLGKKHTALVDLNGAILPDTATTADSIVSGLRAAFEDKDTEAVILRINSPGGSPVQSDYVYTEIKRLREKYPEIKLYAVCSDVCASGAYYIAAAADAIYANPSSVIGSIGVLMNGFGFVGTMEKVGVSRRLLTSGEHKGFLDPFSPMSEWDKTYTQHVLDEVHDTFVARVKAGRGSRLNDTDPNLFSGLFWTGIDAKRLGLIDDFGSTGSVARDIIKNDNIVDFTQQQTVLERLAERFGASFSKEIGTMLGLNGSVSLR
ncbi:MAG: peptidase [Gammaproteobacteria bacterium]|jgi:protease-4|nr:peptidase [Gammaproteobacteria bacterium]